MNYYKKLLKFFCLHNINLRKEVVNEKYINLYGDIIINLSKDEKITIIINNYKISHYITDEKYEKMNFEDIFNKQFY